MPVMPDGSLGTLGEGSMAFASNSGSTLVDMGGALGAMGFAMIAGLVNAISENLVASVA